MYGSQSTHAWLPYICLLFSGFSNVYHSACVWPTALKLGRITNFDMLFLVMGFVSLVDEIQFMLINSRHICIRSIALPIKLSAIFLISSVSAKIYYASIRVSNQAGRQILVVPDKGNPQGFKIDADSTLEVTLMSMSTDGAIIKPVMFRAKDADTMTPFLINYKDTPYPVKPLDNKKEFANLVVSVPGECRCLYLFNHLEEITVQKFMSVPITSIVDIARK